MGSRKVGGVRHTIHLPLLPASCVQVLVWFTLIGIAYGAENEIIGPLNVTCQGTSALINFKTKTAFNGRVYVKGSYAKALCNHNFSHSNGNEGSLAMPLDDCGIRQEKPIGNGRGFKYVSIVIISFHPKVITKDDQAYKIECVYQRGESEVLSALNVSDLTTEVYELHPSPPVCYYTLHSGSLTGPVAKYVRVGDSLFHRWTCNSGTYNMFVHSCNASGPGQEQIELVDDTGYVKEQSTGRCAVDEQLMPNLTYSKSMNESWVEIRAFRYQEVESVRFNCKITTCLKDDTTCMENLPKRCLPHSSRRRKRDMIESALFKDQVLYSSPIDLALPFGEELGIDWLGGNSNIITNTSNAVCFTRAAAIALALMATGVTCLVLCIVPIALGAKRSQGN